VVRIPRVLIMASGSRCSEWFEGQGPFVEAIQHALRGRKLPQAVRLIEEVGISVVLDRQIQTMLGWLEELPSPSYGDVQFFARSGRLRSSSRIARTPQRRACRMPNRS
jgi:hypothetical protein